jgi:hypothetical protein
MKIEAEIQLSDESEWIYEMSLTRIESQTV